MKNNLQEQLRWLQNEYCFEKDPAIVKAKEAAQTGFQSVMENKYGAGKPLQGHSNADHSIETQQNQGIHSIKTILRPPPLLNLTMFRMSPVTNFTGFQKAFSKARTLGTFCLLHLQILKQRFTLAMKLRGHL
jgi:hypothetical protein